MPSEDRKRGPWEATPGDRAGPGPLHLFAFLLLTVLTTVVGTLGLVGLPADFALSTLWMAMTLQVVGGVWFGGWGVLAGTLAGLFSNALNAGAPLYVWGFIPANAAQSWLTAWVFRRWRLDPSLPTRKEQAVFVLVGPVASNLLGGALALAALTLGGEITEASQARTALFSWLAGNGLPCLLFGPLLMRAFSPQIAGSPFFCKGWWGGAPRPSVKSWRYRDQPVVVRLLLAFAVAGVVPTTAACVFHTLFLEYHQRDIHAPLLALLLNASVFLSLIVSGFSAEAVQKRVRVLEEGARRIGAGDLDHRIPDLGANELGLLGGTLNRMAGDLVQSREALRLSAEARARDQRELEIARDIQQGFLPQEVPRTEGLAVAARSLPARVVGGDFYDFAPMREGGPAFLIADVSGKGVPAALFTGLTRSLLRVYLSEGRGLAEAVAAVNAFLTDENPTGMFVTLFCAKFDRDNRVLRYANAGHNPPLLVRGGGGEILKLKAAGIPVGLMPEAPYSEGEVAVGPGDVLLLYTDGVTEAFNGREELFGEERLDAVARGLGDAAPDQCIERILAAVQGFSEGAPQSDDITLVVVRIGAG
jgi:serine phosphatase RsbU (regulator of sigma subunit)